MTKRPNSKYLRIPIVPLAVQRRAAQRSGRRRADVAILRRFFCGDQVRCNGMSAYILASDGKARNHDSQNSRNLDVVRLGRLERNFDSREPLSPQFEKEPVPVQGGTDDLGVTNVILVVGLNVAEATVIILELALNEHVGTITVIRRPKVHLIVIAAFRCGYMVKLDLHWLSSRQANGLPISCGAAALAGLSMILRCMRP